MTRKPNPSPWSDDLSVAPGSVGSSGSQSWPGPDSVGDGSHVALVGGRLTSMDALRGLIMVLMVLDHTRDFFTDFRVDPTDLSTTTVPLFLTRWISHFCAPTFVFLAGTSAYLMRALGKVRDAGELGRFLASRGLFLIVLELTLVRLGWHFNWSPDRMVLQVIWAIGSGMMILGGLAACRIPPPIVGLFGALIVLGHNLLDPVLRSWQTGPAGSFGLAATRYLFRPGQVSLAPKINWISAYPILPWFGIMALGYAFGRVLVRERHERVRVATALGLTFCLAFVVLRATGIYGDPNPWTAEATTARTVLSFVNCQKYPPSLQYVLMTLGPALLVLAGFDASEGRIALRDGQAGPIRRFLATLGRVPLFYYLLQWPVIHVLTIAVGELAGKPVPWFDWHFAYPLDYGYSLPFVYFMWILVVAILFVPSRWFAGLKRRRKDWTWLSYF